MQRKQRSCEQCRICVLSVSQEAIGSLRRLLDGIRGTPASPREKVMARELFSLAAVAFRKAKRHGCERLDVPHVRPKRGVPPA